MNLLRNIECIWMTVLIRVMQKGSRKECRGKLRFVQVIYTEAKNCQVEKPKVAPHVTPSLFPSRARPESRARCITIHRFPVHAVQVIPRLSALQASQTEIQPISQTPRHTHASPNKRHPCQSSRRASVTNAIPGTRGGQYTIAGARSLLHIASIDEYNDCARCWRAVVESSGLIFGTAISAIDRWLCNHCVRCRVDFDWIRCVGLIRRRRIGCLAIRI